MADIPYDNSKIEQWAKTNLNSIKSTIDALGIKHRPKSPSPTALKNSITVKNRQRDGFIDRIGFGMPRSLNKHGKVVTVGVFVHKGVSSGHPASNPRRAKKWFDIPTEINMPALQEIVAENDCTYIINNLTIK